MKRKLSALILAIVMLCSMVPSAMAGSIYTAKEIKVKHDFQTDGVDDGKGAATYVEVEGGYYVSPWKYTVENISLTVTYKGTDYKSKTKDLKLDGLNEVKISVFEQGGKVIVSTESAPDGAEKIAKFKVDLKTWTVIAMPKTEGLEMAVKFQYKDAKPDPAKNVDAYPLDASALEQAEAETGTVQLIHDFKECKGTTDETKEIRTLLKPDANGVYFASRWDYKMATKEGDAGVGPNIDCKVVYNGANKKMKGEDITPDANNCGTLYFFDTDGKLDVDKEVPAGATLLAECTMSLDGAIWFTPKSDKITAELEFNYDAGETYDVRKNVEQVKNEAPAEKPANPFTDVAESSPYYQGILWAVEQKITNGATATTFAPANPCTRAQIVTFLWRAAGSPEPKLTEAAYMDVTDPDAYYYKAVQWAAEMDMEGSGTFRPNETCTRFDAVHFIWRANGSPAPKAKTAFTDMAEEENRQFLHPIECVHWAVEAGVTKGTGDGTAFSPLGPCTRGQIATFLYRAAQA
ncbi:S-layer homology domain-containing protein [uncultured Dysosmobacter sp.]|uniref:S-layer homology domain-containing protein n=1 Tax=uncultured Dysosmobacter sp. TaxID=2591384 RepID=UPI0026046FEE|nr:S-layer homology domain-containing protein [uncultured Dysosmobacter sp.]